MKIINKCLHGRVSVIALLLSGTGITYGDGYRNPPPTAEGIAKSGVNMVFVNDASAMTYNPANLAGMTNSSFVFNMTMARTENEFKSDFPGIEATSSGDWQPLPNIYFSTPIGENGTVAGISITTPYGQGSEYDKEDLENGFLFGLGAPPPIHEALVAVINFNPTIAFQISDAFSLGVGADFYVSSLNFKQFYPWDGNTPFTPDQNAEADGTGYGLGGNLGLTYDLTKKQKVVLTYRSEFTIEYDGDLEVSPNGSLPPTPTSPPLVDSSFDMDITYPNIIGAGYGIVLGDNVRIEANVEWLEWSSNESLDADLGANGKLSIPQDWDNTFTFGVGGDWQINDNWIVRAGYAFIETPIPDETMAPILPDADRHALSLGFGYTTGRHTFDAAYTFSIYDDREPSAGENPLFPGSYEIDSDLIGMTYSFSF